MKRKKNNNKGARRHDRHSTGEHVAAYLKLCHDPLRDLRGWMDAAGKGRRGNRRVPARPRADLAGNDRLQPLRAAAGGGLTPSLKSARGKSGRGKASGGGGGGFRHAGFTVAQPVTLRLTSTRAPPAQPVGRQFKAAAGALKRAQRLIRQTEALLRRAEHEATRRTLKPVRRSIHSSRAELWRWYRALGLSWARFVADHGQP